VGIVLLIIAAICGFLFPYFLIDAIKSNDEETIKTAKTMSCITFGVLILIIGFFILVLIW
jgi:uncharacterized membrane protein SpoIIM required for sporulation